MPAHFRRGLVLISVDSKIASNETLTDKKRRETNDKPCQKIFGACCAKETDNGGKDIKCGGDFEDA